ncbi:unnamed protein product [Gadus morhua 'NCC']
MRTERVVDVGRVLVVDWDVHHGQGIQYAFEKTPGAGLGYTINLPWNKTGMTDADTITAFQHLLLPVAYQFQPQLVLVAAGFRLRRGDPKGRVLLALEGGYNLRSTAEGAAACVSSLLGDPCPPLSSSSPSLSALTSISETISAHYPYWSRLQVLEGGPLADDVGH